MSLLGDDGDKILGEVFGGSSWPSVKLSSRAIGKSNAGRRASEGQRTSRTQIVTLDEHVDRRNEEPMVLVGKRRDDRSQNDSVG